MGNHNSGGKPTCLCGNCKLCKHRIANRKWKKKTKTSDEDLEKKMNEKFQKEGWD